MKSLVAALAMIFATPAFATSIQWKQEFVFQAVEINGQETELTGVVTLNHFDNEVTVRLYNDRCGSLLPAEPGTFRCLAMASLEREFKVKMEAKNDGCGSYIYEGQEDRTPADGLMTQISVADHRQRLCENYLPHLVEATVVTGHLRAPHPTFYTLTKPIL